MFEGISKLLSLKNFSWNSNDFSQQFQNSRTADNFVTKFMEVLAVDRNGEGTDNQQEAVETDSPNDQSSHPPPKKRPKVLLPASCRDSEDTAAHDNEEYNDKKMDEEIESHFQGT